MVIHPLICDRMYQANAVLPVLLQYRLRLKVHQVLLHHLDDLAEVLQRIPIYKLGNHLQNFID